VNQEDVVKAILAVAANTDIAPEEKRELTTRLKAMLDTAHRQQLIAEDTQREALAGARLDNATRRDAGAGIWRSR
jgi:hypothetical protein